MQNNILLRAGKGGDGFTLIEAMIVVAIIAILAAIALPSYTAYVRRAHRADAEQQLMTLAQLNQQSFLDTRTFWPATCTLASIPASIPSSVSSYYNICITLNAGPPASFTVSAAPYGTQASDTCGTLTLTSSGAKTSSSGSNCW